MSVLNILLHHWHLSVALGGSVNLNHARKIQPCAILELPEAFTISSKHVDSFWHVPHMFLLTC